FFFSSRRRHTSFSRDWSSDVCSSDLHQPLVIQQDGPSLLLLRELQRREVLLDDDPLRFRLGRKAIGEIRLVDAGEFEVERLPQRSEERRVGKERRTRGARGPTRDQTP